MGPLIVSSVILYYFTGVIFILKYEKVEYYAREKIKVGTRVYFHIIFITMSTNEAQTSTKNTNEHIYSNRQLTVRNITVYSYTCRYLVM